MTRLNESIEQSLDWRYAVKKFDPSRKISDADWATLSQALVKAPSSYGLHRGNSSSCKTRLSVKNCGTSAGDKRRSRTLRISSSS